MPSLSLSLSLSLNSLCLALSLSLSFTHTHTHTHTHTPLPIRTSHAVPLCHTNINSLVLTHHHLFRDVDREEFRANVTALGVVAEASAIDAVFDELDEDGGGSLDTGELKVRGASRESSERDSLSYSDSLTYTRHARTLTRRPPPSLPTMHLPWWSRWASGS